MRCVCSSHLGHKRGLPRCWWPSEQRCGRPVDRTTLAAFSVAATKPMAQAARISNVPSVRSVHVDRDALLQHVQSLACERVCDVGVLRRELLHPPRAKHLEVMLRQLARRVVPRVQRNLLAGRTRCRAIAAHLKVEPLAFWLAYR